MNRQEHWESVYRSKSEKELGWYRPHLERSLRLIRETGVGADARLIDVGGGASTLVDDLLDAGFRHVSVLDISDAAMASARSRLGPRATGVRWVVGDITSALLPGDHYDLWHERAVFHFLTSAAERASYLERLKGSLKKGGHVVIAAFGPSAPKKCSGLDVVRYSHASLQAEFGAQFLLTASEEETHITPSGVEQHYVYCRFLRGKIGPGGP